MFLKSRKVKATGYNANGANNSSSGGATPLGGTGRPDTNSTSQMSGSAYNIRCKEILEMYNSLRELG